MQILRRWPRERSKIRAFSVRAGGEVEEVRVAFCSFGIHGLERFVPPSSRPARNHIQEAFELVVPGGRIADLGAGGRRIRPGVITVDLDEKTRPDVIADLTSVPLPSGSFDGIFCTGTLEHVDNPDLVGAEIVRLLRPGGIACIDVPFMQGFHADPHDYRRWTLPGLQRFVRGLGLEEERSGVHLGPASAINWVVGEYCRLLVGGTAGKVALALARIACTPLYLTDRWVAKREGAHRIASGVFVIARKP